MSDEHQIHNLLTEEESPDWLSQYSDKQNVYLTPVNLGNYTQQIQFDLKTLRSQFFVLAESYLMLPLRFSSSSTDPLDVYSDATRLAFKRSVIDLISGVMIQNAGSTISNIQNQMMYNNIKQRLEHDLVWNDMEKAQLCSSIDTVPSLIAASGSQLPSLALPTDALISSGSRTNDGLLERVFAFKNQVSFTAAAGSNPASYTGVFKLPLKYIHTLFQAMDFPIVNQTMMLYFYLNLSSLNTSYPPMVCPGSGVDFPAAPTISIQPVGNIAEPRLYVSVVKFKPELTQTISSALARGITKKIHFTESELRVLRTNSASNSEVSDNVSASVVAPTRLFLLSPPTGTLSQANCRALALNVAPITGLQARVNNLPVYELTPDTEEQLYELLKEQFSNYGSDIAPAGSNYTYRNWINGNRVYCVDFRKYGNRITNSNESVSVQVQFKQGTTSTPVDWIAILERKLTMKLNMSDAGVSTIVGAGEL